MDPQELAPYIDHAVLRPDAGAGDIERACLEAIEFRFRGLVVPSGALDHARALIGGDDVKLISTVAFPHGSGSAESKLVEAQKAIEAGADEIDYVIAIGAAIDGDMKYIHDEGAAMIRAAPGRIVKAILEVGYLSHDAIYNCADALADAGVPYVKTCTGFGPGEATVGIVELMRRAIGGRALIKASGGIRDVAGAKRLLDAGASVLGTSRGPELCSP